MTSLHGRAGRRGRSKPLAALAASALGLALVASADRAALACHISHDHGQSSTSTTAESTPTSATTTTTTPATAPAAAHDLMKPWDERARPEPQVIAPSPSVVPATRVMLPGGSASGPSVRDWHPFAATSRMPPAPPAAAASGVSPTAQARSITPLKAPAVYLNPPLPTPAPEPSTILSALAMAGAFAWSRRANRPRG